MEKNEYKELKSLLAKGFLRVDKRLKDFVDGPFSRLEGRVGSLEGKVGWLERNAVTRDEVEEIVERAAGRKIDKILTILDEQSKYFQEQDMIKSQLDRHERWIHDVAKDTGTRPEY